MTGIKVLLLSASDSGGGAQIATCRLLEGLCRAGINVKMLVGRKKSGNNYVKGPRTKFGRLWQTILPVIDDIPCRLFKSAHSGIISTNWVPDTILAKAKEFDPDLINLHFVGASFLRPESLPKFKCPLIWTLHDMWAFSGGEHYSGGSARYKEGYLPHNRPTNESGFDLNRWVWKRKLKAWANLENLTIVTPSQWMAECARESVLFKNYRIEVIANGIDHDRFHPIEHSVVRDILNLPKDKRIILFGAAGATGDPRKGFHFLQTALLKLAAMGFQDNTEVVIFGASRQKEQSDFGFRTHYMGRLNDEISLALVYACADVFICASTQDNLPNTVMESLACGTPVVGFDVGGVADMIEHQRNGYLARPFDTDDLSFGISWVLSDQERWRSLSLNARKKVEMEFTLERQSKKYIELFEDVVS
jgi:glycosyltransferase involved in cell wall biosynthesis